MKKTIPGGTPFGHDNRQISTVGKSLLKFASVNPEVWMHATKLVTDPDKRSVGNNTPEVKVSLLQSIAERAKNYSDDISNIYEIIPEVSTAEAITVSSILSPNDLTKEELIWSIDGDFPTQLATPLLDVIRDTFEKDYKINSHLSPALSQALFTKGSYILGIFPESAIDDTIRGRSGYSIESFKKTTDGLVKGIGILGPVSTDVDKVPTFSYESLYGTQDATMSNDEQKIHTNLLVTDNPSILKLPTLLSKHRSNVVKSKLNISSESYTTLDPNTVREEITPSSIINEIYKDVRSLPKQDVTVIQDQTKTSRKSIGRPLIMLLPHTATIPVHVPGDPEEHIGYFVLLDQSGRPVTSDSESSIFKDSSLLSQRINDSNDSITSILKEIKTNTAGSKCDTDTTLRELDAMYSSLIEKDLLLRLTNGIYGEAVQLGYTDDIYRIMLARALAGMRSHLLFLPANLVQYIAFDYDKYGVGVSLVAKARLSAALTATGIYASQIAMTKNAVQTKVANIQLDPKDPDPWKRRSQILNNLARQSNYSFLTGVVNPMDIESNLNRVSYEINTTGHPDMPDMSVSVDSKSGDKAIVDDALLDGNLQRFLTAIKFPNFLISMVSEPEFAAQVATQNVLFAKPIRTWSIRFSQHILDFIKKATVNDSILLRELTKVIADNRSFIPEDLIDETTKDAMPVIERFLENLKVSLPLPEMKTENTPVEMVNKYVEFLEKVLPYMYNRDDIALIIPEFTVEGDDENEIAAQRADIMQKLVERFEEWLKDMLVRKYISDNNLFPELRDVLYLDSENPNKEIMKSHLSEQQNLVNTFSELVSDMFLKMTGGKDATSSEVSSDNDTNDSEPTTDNDVGEEPNEPDNETPEEEGENNEEEKTEEETKGENNEDNIEDLEIPNFESYKEKGVSPKSSKGSTNLIVAKPIVVKPLRVVKMRRGDHSTTISGNTEVEEE